MYVKKWLVVMGICICLLIVSACSQEPKAVVAEKPKTYSQLETEQESVKVVKLMFKHLDKNNIDGLYKDIQNYDTTFVSWTPTTYEQWDSEKFLKKFSGFQYGTHTQLSIIPSSDWSQNFKELDYRHKTLILAHYTGEYIENHSLVIPVVYDADNRKFKINMIESVKSEYVSSISKEALKKYQMASLPYKFESDSQKYSSDPNYVEDTSIIDLIKFLHDKDTRKFGRYISTIQRKDASRFLVTTNSHDVGKDEIIIELTKNKNKVIKWRATQYKTGDVLWQSNNWNEK